MEEQDDEQLYREMNEEDDFYMGPEPSSLLEDTEKSEEELAEEDIYRKMNPNDPFYMGPEPSDDRQTTNKGCLILLLPLIGTALWMII